VESNHEVAEQLVLEADDELVRRRSFDVGVDSYSRDDRARVSRIETLPTVRAILEENLSRFDAVVVVGVERVERDISIGPVDHVREAGGIRPELSYISVVRRPQECSFFRS